MTTETPKTPHVHADEAPKTRRSTAIAELPPAIAIEIRRRACASRFLMRLVTTNRRTRAYLAKKTACSYAVPRAAVSRLLISIELAALADAQDRAALDLSAQRRAANAGRGDLPWADRRKEMDERPRRPKNREVNPLYICCGRRYKKSTAQPRRTE